MKVHLGGLCILFKVNAKKFDQQNTFCIQHTTMVVYKLGNTMETIKFHDDLNVRPIVKIKDVYGSADKYVIETVQRWTSGFNQRRGNSVVIFRLIIECQMYTLDEHCRPEISFPRSELRPAKFLFDYNNNDDTEHEAAEQLFKVLTNLIPKQ